MAIALVGLVTLALAPGPGGTAAPSSGTTAPAGSVSAPPVNTSPAAPAPAGAPVVRPVPYAPPAGQPQYGPPAGQPQYGPPNGAPPAAGQPQYGAPQQPLGGMQPPPGPHGAYGAPYEAPQVDRFELLEQRHGWRYQGAKGKGMLVGGGLTVGFGALLGLSALTTLLLTAALYDSGESDDVGTLKGITIGLGVSTVACLGAGIPLVIVGKQRRRAYRAWLEQQPLARLRVTVAGGGLMLRF
jgi:hypothetical protein